MNENYFTIGQSVQHLCGDMIWVWGPTSLLFNTRLNCRFKNKAVAQLNGLPGTMNEICPAQTTETSELNPSTFCTFFCGYSHIHSATTLQLKVVCHSGMQLLKYPLKNYRGKKKTKEDTSHTSNTIIDDVMTTPGEMSHSPLLTRIL